MLTLYSEFAGVGGDTLGASRVPGVRPMLAVNHWQVAVDSHAANFPEADHECCDARALDMAAMPRADIFWASPACPPWTDARGKKRDFDKQTVQQGVLFGETQPDERTKRARALMEEIPRYLAAMALHGKPVLVGVVENVIQCRLWADWDRSLGRDPDWNKWPRPAAHCPTCDQTFFFYDTSTTELYTLSLHDDLPG